jgi:methylated-DNA-[protein]-cysteine S-methyltransferase
MPQISMHSPVGDLTIFDEDGEIVALEWGWGADQSATPLLQKVKAALEGYFDGAPLPAGLPLAPRGTVYRQAVWAALRAIPAGQTCTYKDIARVAGGSPRSVGGANAANPIPILIPCHRVVATAGLGGYSGNEGLATKRALLALEGWRA